MEDYEDIQCPYCAQIMPVEIDLSGGPRQDFYLDCDNCCRPIEVLVHVNAEGEVLIYAKPEVASP